MSVTAIIPARFDSRRFPGKALADFGGVPLVVHVAQRVEAAKLVDRTVVATDDTRIRDAVRSHGHEVIMTQGVFATGSDRVASVAARFESELIINVQGDNADLDSSVVDSVVRLLANPAVQVATPVCPFPGDLDPSDPNKVKVLVDSDGRAVRFSRSLIPLEGPWLLHIGVYGFRKNTLLKFADSPRSPSEREEDLEQLRLLDHGVPIQTILVEQGTVSIDTASDLLPPQSPVPSARH